MAGRVRRKPGKLTASFSPTPAGARVLRAALLRAYAMAGEVAGGASRAEWHPFVIGALSAWAGVSPEEIDRAFRDGSKRGA